MTRAPYVPTGSDPDALAPVPMLLSMLSGRRRAQSVWILTGEESR
jgi:hypothetical protein